MSMSRRRRADVDMVASNLERTNLPGAGETRGAGDGRRGGRGGERRGAGGRPVREREEEDRIRLVDKTGGEIVCGGTERADLAQARRKKKSLARTPRRSPLTRHHAAPCTWCY